MIDPLKWTHIRNSPGQNASSMELTNRRKKIDGEKQKLQLVKIICIFGSVKIRLWRKTKMKKTNKKPKNYIKYYLEKKLINFHVVLFKSIHYVLTPAQLLQNQNNNKKNTIHSVNHYDCFSFFINQIFPMWNMKVLTLCCYMLSHFASI